MLLILSLFKLHNCTLNLLSNEEEFLTNHKKSISAILDSTFQDSSKIKVIVIHGPTSSGKSTITKKFKSILEQTLKVFVIGLDDFYMDIPKEIDIMDYDFDNPGRTNWKKLHKLLRSINEKEEKLLISSYCKQFRVSNGEKIIDNPFPDVVLIEGNYSLNLFSDITFKQNEFDPLNSMKEGYEKNHHEYSNFEVLKIKFASCSNIIKKARICRDVRILGRTNEFMEAIWAKQIEPAMIKWVNSPYFKAEIIIKHGTFNENECNLLLKSIVNKLCPEIPVFPLKIDSGLKIDLNSCDCLSESCFRENPSE